MGRALVFFRQATADAATARRKESEQTRTLESRRQLVETATYEFGRAVSDIAKTLDRAAAAMTVQRATWRIAPRAIRSGPSPQRQPRSKRQRMSE